MHYHLCDITGGQFVGYYSHYVFKFFFNIICIICQCTVFLSCIIHV